jgi:hypothetical protein
MAADYIPINRAKQNGNSCVRIGDMLRELRELIDKENDIIGHSFTGADYSVLEANFGLQAGAGANFATLMGNLNNILNTNTTITGQARLDQIDEYCARVAGQ